MSENDKLTVATHLYVRLRRHSGRVVDVLWMLRNQDYAREILKLAHAIEDDELTVLADRYEELMTGIVRPRTPARVAETVIPIVPDVASRYRGALR